MDIISDAGGAGSFSFDDSFSPSLPSTGRARVRSADFGLPERTGLLDLARTGLPSASRTYGSVTRTPARGPSISNVSTC